MTYLTRLERDDFFNATDIGGRPGWRKILAHETGRQVFMRMPCGHVLTLGEDHEIDSDGEINPRVVCSIKKCKGFSDQVTLKGWTP